MREEERQKGILQGKRNSRPGKGDDNLSSLHVEEKTMVAM